MPTSTSYQRNRQSGGPAAYLGWSHANSRMEMMDLPAFLDSLQQSYDSAQQAYGSMVAAVPGAAQWGAAPTGAPQRHHGHDHGHEHGHGHGHQDRDCGCGDTERDCGCGGHHDHDHDRGHGRGHEHGHDHGPDCGCGAAASCRCDCCVEDADIVVYAHCGEVRVVPIEIDNDTRKARDDVSLEISEVRTAGGRVLSWPTSTSADGPLTLDACSTTQIEIRVEVDCPASDPDPAQPGGKTPDKGKASGNDPAGQLRAVAPTRGTDLDECVVGYFTVRLGGCLTRPIVVAIAALPLSCDSYRTGCACSCCC